MHGYVSGTDVASVSDGSCWKPPCCRRNHAPPGNDSGLHATWDYPHRYIQRRCYCPCFHQDGTKDLVQWLPGSNILTRAAKDRWIDLLARYDLPLPNEPAPQFQK